MNEARDTKDIEIARYSDERVAAQVCHSVTLAARLRVKHYTVCRNTTQNSKSECVTFCYIMYITAADTARSHSGKLTPAVSGTDQPEAVMLGREAFAMHSDSQVECWRDWCRAPSPPLILDRWIIWPKHQLSHLQVMLCQNGRALQSIIWPVYVSAHEARVLGLGLRTTPVQVPKPNGVHAIRLCPAAQCMPCEPHAWTSAENT